MTQQPKELDFLEKFTQTFEMFSYGNTTYGRLCAHVLLGQVLKNVKIYFGPIYVDPRVSIFVIQPSGTGKSTPWNLIRQVGEKSQMKIEDIDDATDSALVGHVESQEIIDPETKTKVVSHNIVKGKLAIGDILHYDEGWFLVKPGQFSQNALTWFQKALNPIGQNRCVRPMANGTVDFYPTCSLIITSHELEEAIDIVFKRGFFQRIVLLPRYIPISDRKQWEFLRADRLGDRFMSINLDIDNLAEKLMAIRAKYIDDFIFKIDPNVKPVLKSKIDEFYKLINSVHERVREIMATFVPRFDNLMYIFSFHHSCVKFKDVVDLEDVNYGYNLAYGMFKEVLTWVEENIPLLKLTSKEQSYITSAYMVYQAMEKNSEGFVFRYAFAKACSEKWRISMPTVNRYLEKFKGFGKLQEVEKDKIRWVKILA